jgi:hypothetical protein
MEQIAVSISEKAETLDENLGGGWGGQFQVLNNPS